MKKSLLFFHVFILAIFILSGANVLAQTTSKVVKQTSTENKATTSAKAVTREDIELDVAEALTLIETYHVEGKKLDYNGLFKTAIDSMLHSLDPHSNYFDAKEFEEFRTNQSSQYFGIGATIGDLSDKDGKVVATYIKATFDNAPAHRAGLQYGDKILSVNGTSMVGKPFNEVRDFLRGPRGTVAKITVERFSSGKHGSRRNHTRRGFAAIYRGILYDSSGRWLYRHDRRL